MVKMQVGGSRSLKEKRQVLRSLIDKLRADFNLSVAEVAHHDLHQTAQIALACVGNDSSYVNAVLDKALDRLLNDPRVIVSETELELW
jgi:uncharacterized protein YlxP (DUF503 family)